MVRTTAMLGCLLFSFTTSALAAEFRTGNLVSIGPDEVIDDDLFVAGSDILVAGKVTGDIFAAGRSVKVTGPVGGSVMAAGSEVVISGEVEGSVRAAGQTVTVSGSVGRNVAVAGGVLALEEAARVARDLHAAGNSARVDGDVSGRASIASQAAMIGGKVGQDCYFEGEQLSLTPTAEIAGTLLHRSRQKPEIASGARVLGPIQALAPHEAKPARPRRGWDVLFALAVFVFGVVGLAAFPRVFTAAANALHTRWWWNLVLGFLALVVPPLAAIIVCITIIGLPIGLLALFLWGIGIVAAGVPVGIFGGRLLTGRGRRVSPYLALLIGLLALTLLGFVPYLGGIVKFLTVLFGLGVYARAVKGVIAEMRLQPA